MKLKKRDEILKNLIEWCFALLCIYFSIFFIKNNATSAEDEGEGSAMELKDEDFYEMMDFYEMLRDMDIILDIDLYENFEFFYASEDIEDEGKN